MPDHSGAQLGPARVPPSGIMLAEQDLRERIAKEAASRLTRLGGEHTALRNQEVQPIRQSVLGEIAERNRRIIERLYVVSGRLRDVKRANFGNFPEQAVDPNVKRAEPNGALDRLIQQTDDIFEVLSGLEQTATNLESL